MSASEFGRAAPITPAPTPIRVASTTAASPSVIDTGKLDAMMSFTRHDSYCSDGPRSNTKRRGGACPAAAASRSTLAARPESSSAAQRTPSALERYDV